MSVKSLPALVANTGERGHSRNDTTNRQHKSQQAGILEGALAHNPAEQDDRAGLEVAHDGAADGTSLLDDDELRDVDGRGEQTADQHHRPRAELHAEPDGAVVAEGDHVEHNTYADGGLVQQQLPAIAAELLVEGLDPDGVDGRGANAGQREEDTDRRRLLRLRLPGRVGVEVRHDGDAEANRNQRETGLKRQRLTVEDEVEEGAGRGQQDPRDLVELNARVGEREVLQHHVQDHGARERQDLDHVNALRLEDADDRPRQTEEHERGDAEVQRGEGHLRRPDGLPGVGEDGFVHENL